MDEQKKQFNPIIPVLITGAVLLIALSVLCFKLWQGKKKAEQTAAEYKASYENLLEENRKADAAAKAAKKKGEEYQASYNRLVYDMVNSAALAENKGNLIIKVWSNAIWSEVDSETDKYTKKNGQFVSDFNDALASLFTDEDFVEDMCLLSDGQDDIKKAMKDMLDPPEGYENAFKALESMYNSYIEFSNIVIRVDGSLESFSNDFAEADDDLGEKYHAAELYVK